METQRQRDIVDKLGYLRTWRDGITRDTPVYVLMEDGELRKTGVPFADTVDGEPAILIYAGVPVEEDDEDEEEEEGDEEEEEDGD